MRRVSLLDIEVTAAHVMSDPHITVSRSWDRSCSARLPVEPDRTVSRSSDSPVTTACLLWQTV
jgi:hypothetical protein